MVSALVSSVYRLLTNESVDNFSEPLRKKPQNLNKRTLIEQGLTVFRKIMLAKFVKLGIIVVY